MDPEIAELIRGAYDPPGAWYAVYANVRSEKRAEMSLRDAGLDSFMPYLTRWARSGRRKYKAQDPLFLRYLFVFVPGERGERDFYTVRACEGVERVVGVEGAPSAIPTSFVHALRQQQLLGDFDQTLERNVPEGPFPPGEEVKVRVGRWADWPGKVVKMTAKGRVKVLLSMFGKEHEHEFEPNELKVA